MAWRLRRRANRRKKRRSGRNRHVGTVKLRGRGRSVIQKDGNGCEDSIVNFGSVQVCLNKELAIYDRIHFYCACFRDPVTRLLVMLIFVPMWSAFS